MGSYRLTRRADQNLIDIYLYSLERFGLEQAERYAAGLKSCFNLLAANPHLGRRADAIRPGTRRHEHGRHVIFYRESSTEVGLLILTAMHRSMLPSFLAEELP